jgi:hypothetical protein
MSIRINLQFPDSTTHVEWLAVHLFPLLLQVHVRVDLEDTRTVAWHHFIEELSNTGDGFYFQ